MALVSVSIGSNINREFNIRRAVQALHEYYDPIAISPVYETAAVGFEGEDFLNLAVSFESDQSVEAIAASLKAIEDRIGRDRSQPKFSARTIDLDLLTYDDQVLDEGDIQIPRHEILKNAFVLKPLSDIHGDRLHPLEHKTYRQLWLEMKPDAARIKRITLDL